MATLYLTGGTGQFTWRISGLGNPFNTDYYKSAGITVDKFTVGDVTSINESGIVRRVYAPSYGSSTSISESKDYPAGTYTLWGFAQAANGRYYPAGSDTMTISGTTIPTDPPPPPDRPRPSDWYWTNPIIIGQNINITASDWNNFTRRINDFRYYKHASNYSFTTVSSGQIMYANVADEARKAIQSIPGGHGQNIPQIYSGSEIKASYFGALRIGLNDIY